MELSALECCGKIRVGHAVVKGMFKTYIATDEL